MLRLSTWQNGIKYFSQVSCRFGQSTNICLTVSGSLQDSQTAWLSPDIRYEWIRRQWPSWSLLRITTSWRERVLVCKQYPQPGRWQKVYCLDNSRYPAILKKLETLGIWLHSGSFIFVTDKVRPIWLQHRFLIAWDIYKTWNPTEDDCFPATGRVCIVFDYFLYEVG